MNVCNQIRSFIIPDELNVQFASFCRHYQLVILPLDHVAIGEHPSSSTFGFVVLEVALEVGAVRIGPFA